MSTNFKQNVSCILTGKQNFQQWFVGLRSAAKFETLWWGHLDSEPTQFMQALSPPSSSTSPPGSPSKAKTPIQPAVSAADLQKWRIDDDKIRAGILLVIDYSLHSLIDEIIHTTAWSVLEVLKKNFDTKSDLEFVHLIMKMNQMKMQKGKSHVTINALRPIKTTIDKQFTNQCITWAFLIQSCLHIPDYKNLLTSLSGSGVLKTMNFEQLAEKFVELDKTFDTDFSNSEPIESAFQVKDQNPQSSRGRGRGRGTTRGRGRGPQPQRQSFGQQNQTKFASPSNSFRQSGNRQNTGKQQNFPHKSGNSGVQCNRCGRPGHVSTRCLIPANQIPHLKHDSANLVDEDSLAVKGFQCCSLEDKVTQVNAHCGFTAEKSPPIQLSEAIFNDDSSDAAWILDTGTSRHMTG